MTTTDPTSLCVACCEQLNPAPAVKLTARSAMCPRCHREAYEAWQEDYAHCNDHRRCPDPAELQARIEAVREAAGESVRHDRASSLPGNLLYMPKKIAFRSARRRVMTIGDV